MWIRADIWEFGNLFLGTQHVEKSKGKQITCNTNTIPPPAPDSLKFPFYLNTKKKKSR